MDANIRMQESGADTDTTSRAGMHSADSDARSRSYKTKTNISLGNIQESLNKLKEWHAAGLIDTDVWKEKQARLIQDL